MNTTEIDLFDSPASSKKDNPQGADAVTALDFFALLDEPLLPSWLAAPGSSLECRFAAFHKANPHVYAALEQRALRDVAQGAKRLGIAKLAEQLRADPAIATDGDAFKINNSFRAFYARLLIHRHPKLEGIMEVRSRVEEGRTVE